jgi:hypothetical protein
VHSSLQGREQKAASTNLRCGSIKVSGGYRDDVKLCQSCDQHSSMLLCVLYCCVQVPRGRLWAPSHGVTPMVSLPASSAAVD